MLQQWSQTVTTDEFVSLGYGFIGGFVMPRHSVICVGAAWQSPALVAS
jgi:hypothetical protein